MTPAKIYRKNLAWPIHLTTQIYKHVIKQYVEFIEKEGKTC